MASAHDVTRLLGEWANGDQEALNRLTPLVYGELRQLAAAYLRKERPDHTLQPTALVHEVYLRLVDHARRRQAGKRSGHNVPLEETVSFAHERSADLVALDDSLSALEKLDPRKCRAVELRYFGGLRMEEIARALEVSPITVRRDLRMAEAWLYRQMRSGWVPW